MSKVYYNENDSKCCEWLRCLMHEGLITTGDIDGRSIKDVRADDLLGYKRAHFFGGIGGWDLALQLAGWPTSREVWTGSCPCQPFSAAGKGKGTADERHLWPEWFRLIKECRPAVIFGEQVASSAVVGKAGKGHVEFTTKELTWIDAVFDDLEGASYTCAAFDLPAAGVNAPHIRQRLFWVAYRSCERWEPGRGGDGSNERNVASTGSEHERVANSDGGRLQEYMQRNSDSSKSKEQASSWNNISGCGEDDRLANTSSSSRAQQQREPGNESRRKAGPQNTAEYPGFGSGVAYSDGRQSSDGDLQRSREHGLQSEGCGVVGLENSEHSRFEGRKSERNRASAVVSSSHWSDIEYTPCRDGKARPVKSGLCCLVDGFSARMADGTEIGKKEASRVTMLRGLGNAIVPQLVATM